MDGKVRVSIMALLAPDRSYSDIQPFVREHLGADSEREYRRFQGAMDNPDGCHRLQVKYSRVIPAAALDEAGLLRIANAFRSAGHGDVAWKVTPVAPGDPDPENTTSSFPVEIFQACLDDEDLPDENAPDIPPEPFGSDDFWKWFDDNET
jgi:hypothetical protein